MGRPARVLGQSLLFPERFAQPHSPAWVEALGGLARHPRGETLVQPQVVPPGHRDEVAEPLVRDLVRDDAVDALLLAQRIFRVVQEAAFVVGDRPPVFHRAAYATGKRDLVQLGQRVRLAEVAVVIAHDLLGRLHRVACALALAFHGVDAEPDSIDAVFQEIHLSDEERHQIRRHGHRSGEAHFLPAVGPELDLGLRHVRHCGQGRVDYCDDIEARAKHRLVPSRKEPARLHRLHLGGEHEFLHEPPSVALLVRYLVQALGMPADFSRVVDAEPVAAGRDRRGRRRKRHRFALRIEAGREARFVPRARTQPHRLESQLGRIDNDRPHGPGDFDVYDRLGVEAVISRRRNDAQRVVPGHYVFGQLPRGFREREARLGACRGEAEQQRSREDERVDRGSIYGSQ